MREIKESGVKRIRIHDFRHSHATNLINDGVNIVAVSKRLGHSDITQTFNTYTHLL
ncbi:MAG: tyrosine-type recombinase/integrase [Erysipelotrichaceae bacterium]|nr:tyrosine-type recombinase/integrase [Erysipelotrichaceae bacterium]